MDDELVLLTSYFNLAGGRRHDTADTFRVESSVVSETSADGMAALYIVTESSAIGSMGARARRVAADTIAWEYQAHNDVPPRDRLKAALRTAHEAVARESDGHVTVGASVIAVEHDKIYLAQVAPGQVYVLHEGGLHSINASVDGSAPFARALGGSAPPRISLGQDQIAAGDILSLCSSWFQRTADPAELRDCFGAGTADDIAESILELAKEHDVRDSTVIVIEAALASDLEEPADRDAGPGLREQIDEAVRVLTGFGRTLWMELRTPTTGNGHEIASTARVQNQSDELISATPASADFDTESESAPSAEWRSVEDVQTPVASTGARPITPRHEDEERPTRLDDDQPTNEIPVVPSPLQDDRERYIPGHTDQMTEEVPIVASDPLPSATQTYDLSELAPPASEEESTPEPRPRRNAARRRSRWGDREPAGELDEINSRLHLDQDMADVIPPVQAFPDTSTEPSRIYATSKGMQAANRRPRRFGGIARPVDDDESSTPMVRPGLGDVDLRRPTSRPTPPPAVWAAAAIFLLLVALSLYKFVSHNRSTPKTVNYVAMIQRDVRLAQNATALSTQEFYLAKARKDIAKARLAGTNAKSLQGFSATVLATADRLHHITRVPHPEVLTDFSRIPHSRPSELATAPGLVFVLDSGGHKVFQVTTNSPATSPTQLVTAGETDNTFTIGNPVHIASDGKTALVLDDHNVLVRDAAGNKTVTSFVQSAPNEKIVQMTALDPDVYLLDTANSQLWRYPGGVSQFNPISQPYWDVNKPNISHGVAAAFDGTSLYILRQDGTVLKYDLSANQQRFTMSAHPSLQSPTSLYTAPGQRFIWIADPVHHRVVQFDKLGAVIRSYVSREFGRIDGVAAGPAGNTLYVLSGSRLFTLPVVR